MGIERGNPGITDTPAFREAFSDAYRVLDIASGHTLDWSTLAEKARKASLKALGHAGGFVRKVARNSMRKRKASAAPGSPPSVHVGGLKNLILYAVDPERMSAVIGPTPRPGSPFTGVPGTLEFGGRIGRRPNRRRRWRSVGDGGEIAIGRWAGYAGSVKSIGRGGGAGKATKANGAGVLVTYARLLTAAQAQRANELNEQLYGPDMLPEVDTAARPYMGPALDASQSQLAALWADSVR
jgi:hypothetical protein